MQACSGGQLLTHRPAPAEAGNGDDEEGNSDGSGGDADSGKLLARHPAPAGVSNGHDKRDTRSSCSDDWEEESEAEDYDSDIDADIEQPKAADSVDAICPICHDLFDYPVKAQCGHAFCQVSQVLD